MSDDKNIFGEEHSGESSDFSFVDDSSNEYAPSGFADDSATHSEFGEEEGFDSTFTNIPEDPYGSPSDELDGDLHSMLGENPEQLEEDGFTYGNPIEPGSVYDHAETEDAELAQYAQANHGQSNADQPQQAQKKKGGAAKIALFSVFGVFGIASAGMTGYLMMGDDGGSSAVATSGQMQATMQQQAPTAPVSQVSAMETPALSALPDAAIAIEQPGYQQPQEPIQQAEPVTAQNLQRAEPESMMPMNLSEPDPASRTAVRPVVSGDLGGELASLQRLVVEQDGRIDEVTEKVDGVSDDVKALKGQLASLESKIDKLAAANKVSKPAATPSAQKASSTAATSKPRATIAQTSRQVSKPAAPAKSEPKKEVDADRWYVRGVTGERAIIFKATDGQAYTVSLGMEVPGFGAVVKLRPDLHEVHTTKGILKRKAG